MSEEDYQRGLRGGPERVSISDWERWKDWKAGHDEYERAQEQEDEARFAEVSTPEETRTRLLARIKAREEANEKKLAAMQQAEIYRREIAPKLAEKEDRNGRTIMTVIMGVLCCIGGVVVGFILEWIFGLSVIVTFLVAMAIWAGFVAIWRAEDRSRAAKKLGR